MTLADWLRNGWVLQHQTSREEVAELLKVIERDLADSAMPQLSPDWRMNIAYNAALQAATAALAAEGFRASRDQHHHRVIQSLRDTVGADVRLVNTFDAFRKKRNLTGYERAGTVSDAEAHAMREFAVNLKANVLAWLKANHPDLL